jgi:hypothetical protein
MGQKGDKSMENSSPRGSRSEKESRYSSARRRALVGVISSPRGGREGVKNKCPEHHVRDTPKGLRGPSNLGIGNEKNAASQNIIED